MRGKYDDGRRRGNEEWGVIKITFPLCYNLALYQRKEAENTVVLLLKIEQVQNKLIFKEQQQASLWNIHTLTFTIVLSG